MNGDVLALRDELLALGTATLYEASGIDCFMPAALRPAWPNAKIVGRAMPVSTSSGDNLPLHLALEAVEPGEVLVVDAKGAPHGYWGEVLTVAAQVRGVEGLVIDGGVRDTRELEKLGFPVFSSHVALRGTEKQDVGTVGEPIRLGDVEVRRGDVVVADQDGVIVLPAESLRTVLNASRARVDKERDFVERLRAGASTVDLYSLPRA